MPLFTKKPVTIEARQVNTLEYDELCDIVAWCGGRAVDDDGGNHVIAIDTLEGTMFADHGDYIICGVKGEFYPCKPDIFDATYEPAEPQTWRCPGCWQRWPIESDCGNCGSNHPGLYRHPPVDPETGEVSAADNAIRMGDMRHCDVPAQHRDPNCLAVMNDHGYDDVRGVLCPPDGTRP